MTHVEQREGGYLIAGTRVSLDSVVYAYLRGESPARIAESFPALTLEQILGALAYSSVNREAIDQYPTAAQMDFENLRQQWRSNNPSLYAKLVEALRKGPPVLSKAGIRSNAEPWQRS